MFSEKARMVNNIYYGSVEYDNSNCIYYNITDYDFALMKLNTFVYKVAIDSNDVYSLTPSHVTAIKYRVKEEINFNEWIEAAQFTEDEFGQDKIEWDSIIDGSMVSDEVLSIYNKIMRCQPWSLSFAQIIKLHAILNQKTYELPILKLLMWNKEYARVYEFYGREYEFDSNHKPFFKVFEAEAALGSKRFEYIENEDCEILMYDMTSFLKLVATRKLTQNQFEYCCMYSPFLTTVDKKKFVNTALRANYEIPHEGRHLFFPEIIFKHESWVTELKTKHLNSDYDRARLLLLGYKLKDYNYHHSYWATSDTTRSPWTPKHSSTVTSYKSTSAKIKDAVDSAIISLLEMYGPEAEDVIEKLVTIYSTGISNSTYVKMDEAEIEDEIITLVSDVIDSLF